MIIVLWGDQGAGKTMFATGLADPSVNNAYTTVRLSNCDTDDDTEYQYAEEDLEVVSITGDTSAARTRALLAEAQLMIQDTEQKYGAWIIDGLDLFYADAVLDKFADAAERGGMPKMRMQLYVDPAQDTMMVVGSLVAVKRARPDIMIVVILGTRHDKTLVRGQLMDQRNPGLSKNVREGLGRRASWILEIEGTGGAPKIHADRRSGHDWRKVRNREIARAVVDRCKSGDSPTLAELLALREVVRTGE